MVENFPEDCNSSREMRKELFMFRKFFNYVIIILFLFIVITSCNLENSYLESEGELSLLGTSPEKCHWHQQERGPLQTINNVLNALERGRVGHVLRYLANDVEWIVEGEEESIPFAGTYYGKQGVRRFLIAFNRLVNLREVIIDNHVEGEETITSYTRFQGSIPRKRKTFDMEYVLTWELNERNRVEKCSIAYNTCSFELALSTRGKGHIISDTTVSPEAQFFYNYYMAVLKEWMKVATVEELRAAQSPMFPTWPEDANVEEVIIAGLEGDLVQVDPDTADDKIILYLHGGGFVRGDKQANLLFPYYLAKYTKIPVLSVNFPLAPENPFPIIPESCYAVYQELLNDYESENIAITGESSGGNLVLTIALLAKERNEPLPGALIPISPWVNLTNSGGTFITNNETDPSISTEFLNNLANYYLNGVSPENPLASPIFATISGNFPPVYLTVSTCEVLLGDSAQMFNKLVDARVDVTIEIMDGLIHGWPLGIGLAPEPMTTVIRISDFIKDKLNS
jgi:acetyl esterase/lipase/ketosteroid isomerase-like protein